MVKSCIPDIESMGPDEQIIVICRHLYDKGLLAGADGNVSVRSDDMIITTPSGAHKGFMKVEHLVTTGIDGQVIGKDGIPSSEIGMHLAIYEADPECRAVIHTHAPCALALSLGGIGFESEKLAETALLLGEVAEVPFYPPGTRELAEAVASHADRGPVQILERHGAVSRGADLMEAFRLMECLEHNAGILLMVELLGSPGRINKNSLRRLVRI